MAGKKQQAPKPIDELAEEGEAEGWDNVADVDADAPDPAGQRLRDWRDVEKYREMRELRRVVGDEFDFTDVLGNIPVRPRNAARAEAPRARVAAPVQRATPPAARPAPKPQPRQKPRKTAPRMTPKRAAAKPKAARRAGARRAGARKRR